MRRNPPAKWPLPATIDPPRRCIQIQVPNDPAHVAAFRGALLALASAYNWSDDPAHTAKDVALVWRAVVDNSLDWGCDEVQYEFRVNDCELQYRVVGDTEWIILVDLSECSLTSEQVKAIADTEIESQISFTQDDIELYASKNGVTSSKIYDPTTQVKAIADTEIEGQISFTQDDIELYASKNGVTSSKIYDPTDQVKAIADTEIEGQISFTQDDIELYASKNGVTSSKIYDPTDQVKAIADTEIEGQISFTQDGIELYASKNGVTSSKIYDPTDQVKAIADTEIEGQISFTQDDNQLYASTNGVTSHLIYDPTPSSINNLVPIAWQERPAEGATKGFDLICPAWKHVLLPMELQVGDIVQITSISGAWSEESLLTMTTYAHTPPQWFTPDGYYYDQPGVSAPTDPTWDVPKMALVARVDEKLAPIPVYDKQTHEITEIGVSGVGRMWFFAAHVTGFDEALPAISPYTRDHQLDVSGYAAFHVTVHRPSTAWCYEFDFAQAYGGFTAIPYGGATPTYANGRWESRSYPISGGYNIISGIRLAMPDTVLTKITVEFTRGQTDGPNGGYSRIERGGTAYDGTLINGLSGSAGPHTQEFDVSLTNPGSLEFYIDSSGTPDGINYWTKITLRGTGTNPFGSDNCT